MNGSHSALRSAAVFVLCGLFAVLAMGLALLSSGVYRSTTAESDRNFTRRTALSYLVNQIRQADGTGRVAVGTFGGSDALALTEHLDGTEYVTILYCLDGQLRELYTGRRRTLSRRTARLQQLFYRRHAGYLHP